MTKNSNILMLKLKKLIFPVPIESSLIFLNFMFISFDHFLIFFATWLVICVSLKLLLKIILKHEGLVLETRGKDLSMKTRIFKNILKCKLDVE